MKIKVITTLFFSVLLLGSCADNLNISPRGSLSPDDLGQNEVNELLVGLYRSFQNNPSAYSFIVNDLMGEDLINSNLFNSGDLVDFVQGTVRSNNTIVYQMWAGYYNGIYHTNLLLEKLDQLPESTTNQQIYGTAKYFRAYGYFNLVTKWGDVPLVLSSTDNPTSRNSETEIWEAIKADLQEAIALLPAINTLGAQAKYSISREAAQALLARIALYTEDRETATQLSEELINSGTFSLETNFADVYHELSNSELIFAFRYLANETIPVGGIAVPQSLYGLFTTNAYPIRGSYVYYPTAAFQQIFEATDLRRDVSFTNYQGLMMVNKFLNYEPIIVSRIAEMYLISAEAQGLNGLMRLNELRQRRGLEPVDASSEDEYLTLLLDERRKELFCEGHRLQDLKRTDRAMNVLSFINESNRLLLPVPQQEIDLVNDPVNFPQNNGY